MACNSGQFQTCFRLVDTIGAVSINAQEIRGEMVIIKLLATSWASLVSFLHFFLKIESIAQAWINFVLFIVLQIALWNSSLQWKLQTLLLLLRIE